MPGDPLVVVDPTGIREQLTAAQAEFTAAQSELTNAQAAITQAQSRIASAQSQYTHGSATAPFSGKFIASSTFSVGQKVSAGQTIGRMVNDSQMQLAVQFSSEYAKDIKAGQTAHDLLTSVRTGFVCGFSIDSASGKGTFLVVLTVQNPSGALAQGTSATATINSDSAGTIFSSGRARWTTSRSRLSRHRSAVKSRPITLEPHIQQRCSHYVNLQCYSAGYFGRAKQPHGLHRVRLQPHRPR